MAMLAKDLSIDPKYVRIDDSVSLRSRRYRSLAGGGMNVVILLLIDDESDIMASQLVNLTSSTSFWKGINENLAEQRIPLLDTTDVVVEIGIKCNKGFKNTTAGICIAERLTCPKGTYAKAGTGECTFCLSGKYSVIADGASGAFACEACPSNSNSSTGSSSTQQCLCEKGYFMELVDTDGQGVSEAERVCKPCPDNSNCESNGLDQHSLISAQGYWRATNFSVVFYQCPLVAACPGKAFNMSATTMTRDAQCKFGHAGVRCELCDEEKGFVIRPDGTCEQCDAQKRRTTIIMFVVVPLVVITSAWLFIRWLGWKNDEVLGIVRDNFERRASKIRILIGFTQVVSRIKVTFRLTFPPVVMDFLRWLNVFEFLNIFKFVFIPNCLYSMDYYDQLICEVLGPAVVLVLAFVGYRTYNRQWMYEIFLILSFVCFPAFCESLFRFFDCQEYEDGEIYLVVNPSVKCTDDKYLAFYYQVVCFAIVIPFGVIAVYAIELYRNRHFLRPNVQRPEALTGDDLQNISRQLVLAQHKSPTDASKQGLQRSQSIRALRTFAKTILKRRGDDLGIDPAQLLEVFNEYARTKGQRLAEEWLQIVVRDARGAADHLKFLYAAYRPDYFWYEAFELLRKFVLTGLPLLTRLASPESNTEAVWGTVLMAILLFVEGAAEPYIKKSDQYLALPAHLQLVITMVAGLAGASVKHDSKTDLFVAILVIFPACIIIAVLVYTIIDPELETWLSRKLVNKSNALWASTYAKALKMLRPIIEEKVLMPVGLEWFDVECEVRQIDSAQELMEAANDFDTFLVKWAETKLLEETRERIYLRLKFHLEPVVFRRGLTWVDIVEMIRIEFERVRTVQDALDIMGVIAENPELFFESTLDTQVGFIALAFPQLKPTLEPHLVAQGMEWADAVPVLMAIDSIRELRAAENDPKAFVERRLKAVAKLVVINSFKPKFESCLAARGLEWVVDVVPVLETIDSIEELRAAADEPEELLERIVALKQTKQTAAETAEEFVPPEQEITRGDVDCVLGQIQLDLSLAEQDISDVEELERQRQGLDQPWGTDVQAAARAEPFPMEQLDVRLDLAHDMYRAPDL
jgi:hypothetical protein